MTGEQDQIYRAIQEMEWEAEEDASRLPPALEDKLVRDVLSQFQDERQRRQRRIYRLGMAAAVMAIAACFALILGLRTPAGSLPSYALYVTGDEPQLGAPMPTKAPRLAEDSVLNIELSPQAPAPGRLTVHPFLGQGSELRPWPVALSRTDRGVFRLRAPVHELPALHAGSWMLVFAVGAGGTPPTTAQLKEALRHEPPSRIAGWQVFSQSVEIVAR